MCNASSCETSTCDGKGGCLTKLKSNHCLISGNCYTTGALHSGGCAECDPTKSTTSWTVTGATHCLISNVCKKSGDKDSSGCMVCDPSKSKTSWSSSVGCQPTHAWSKGFGGLKSDTPYGMAVDGKGNVYITGLASTTINFGGATLQKGAFIASFTPGGKHRWSKVFGGSSTGSAIGTEVAVDNMGNVYLTGTFFSTINLGGSTLKNNSTNGDVYVASFTASGKHRWSKSFDTANHGGDPSIAVDAAGNTYLTGDFFSKANFGGSTLVSNGANNNTDVFLASFDTNGNHRWSKSFGDSIHDIGRGVAVDSNGNTYITGWFVSKINFGGLTLSSKGQTDVYLASFTASGTHRWAKAFGGSAADSGQVVAVDGSANVFITGEFNQSADFGGGSFVSNGYKDIFVASFTASGKHRWSKAFGGSAADYSKGLNSDKLGNVFATGYFVSSVNYGGGTLTSKGTSDMFIVSLSPAGTHRWSRSHGSVKSDMGHAIATDSSGNTYVLGAFYNTVSFGGGPLTSAGKKDIVLLKLAP